MTIPQDLKYTKDHEWIKIEGNEAYIGITDFAQSELGDIVYIEIEHDGEEIAVGEVFGTVEAVKTVSELFMPVSGKIIEINPDLESTPELVNESPYEKGWMIKIEITNSSELDELLSVEAYKEIIG